MGMAFMHFERNNSLYFYTRRRTLMNVVRKEDIYTIDDIYALPDGERAELLDGQIYYMSPPGTNHQRLVRNSYIK